VGYVLARGALRGSSWNSSVDVWARDDREKEGCGSGVMD
jgi:hypothetical protein